MILARRLFRTTNYPTASAVAGNILQQQQLHRRQQQLRTLMIRCHQQQYRNFLQQQQQQPPPVQALLQPHAQQQRRTVLSQVLMRRYQSSGRGFIGDQMNNGNLFMAFGAIIILFFGVDRYAQFQQSKEFETMQRNVKSEEQRQRKVRQELLDTAKSLPTLYKVKVTTPYKMGGTHALQNVELGMTLEVLKENDGPKTNQDVYYLARTVDPKTNEILSVGWYPVKFCERIENNDKKSKKGWFW